MSTPPSTGEERKGGLAAMQVQIILEGYQACTICYANGKAAEVVVRRTTIDILATVLTDSCMCSVKVMCSNGHGIFQEDAHGDLRYPRHKLMCPPTSCMCGVKVIDFSLLYGC